MNTASDNSATSIEETTASVYEVAEVTTTSQATDNVVNLHSVIEDDTFVETTNVEETTVADRIAEAEALPPVAKLPIQPVRPDRQTGKRHSVGNGHSGKPIRKVVSIMAQSATRNWVKGVPTQFNNTYLNCQYALTPTHLMIGSLVLGHALDECDVMGHRAELVRALDTPTYAQSFCAALELFATIHENNVDGDYYHDAESIFAWLKTCDRVTGNGTYNFAINTTLLDDIFEAFKNVQVLNGKEYLSERDFRAAHGTRFRRGDVFEDKMQKAMKKLIGPKENWPAFFKKWNSVESKHTLDRIAANNNITVDL